MKIEFDGYFGITQLEGPTCTQQELKEMYEKAKQAAADTNEIDLIFANLYDYVVIPYSEETHVHFVIDTDIDRVYTPSY